jgi:hypothetical protein
MILAQPGDVRLQETTAIKSGSRFATGGLRALAEGMSSTLVACQMERALHRTVKTVKNPVSSGGTTTTASGFEYNLMASSG